MSSRASSLLTDLAEQGRADRSLRMTRRELAGTAALAVLFVIAVGLMWLLAPPGGVPVTDLVLLVLATAVLDRVQFEIGAGITVPTQLLFVPMLFVLPPAIVPLAVAAARSLSRLPDVVGRRQHPQRLLFALTDTWYAVGPSVVFAAAGVGAPSFADWPIYLVALAAQLACDLSHAVPTEWLAHGVAPRLQLAVGREVWLVDVLLSPVGLLVAYATTLEPHAYLLVIPLAVLFGLFARERRERISHEIELSAGLRRARERLVTRREEERRRLRRDLHDELGPTLASIVMQLDAAANVLRRDVAGVEPLLVGARRAAMGAMDDVRRLVDELRPPALDELGLIGAIRACAERFACGPDGEDRLELVLEAPAWLPPVPAAVEVAALRIAQEAITNVARHAHAHSCRIEVAFNGALLLVIADDGRGLPHYPRPGVGLASMQERAAELGGQCTVTTVPDGGTCVRAILPLEPS